MTVIAPGPRGTNTLVQFSEDLSKFVASWHSKELGVVTIKMTLNVASWAHVMFYQLGLR